MSRTHPLVLSGPAVSKADCVTCKRYQEIRSSLWRCQKISKVSVSIAGPIFPTELAKNTQEPDVRCNSMQRSYILAPFQSPQFVYAQGSLLTSELSLGRATVSDPLHPRKLDTTGFRADRCDFVHWPLKARHNKYNQKGSKSMKEHK